MKLFTSITLITFALSVFSCTENPFTSEKRAINNSGGFFTGKVVLQGSTEHSGIYIWVKGLGISGYSDKEGNFRLDLLSVRLQPGQGFNGVFQVYFFMSSYIADSVQILIKNGIAVFPQPGFSEDGNLLETISLTEMVRISSLVKQKIIISDDIDSSFNEITGQWTYYNQRDSLLLKTGFDFLPGSNKAILHIPLNKTGTPAFIMVMDDLTGRPQFMLNSGFFTWGQYQTETPKMISFDSKLLFESKITGRVSTQLPEGRYFLQPCFILTQATVPEGLVRSLKPCLFENKATFQFSKIPVRLMFSSFEVKQKQN